MAQNQGPGNQRQNGPWNPPGFQLGGFGEGFGTGFDLYGPVGRQMGLPATAGYYSDEEILRIETSLLENNPYTAEANIDATVKDRVITLTGTAKNVWTKRAAEEDAWSIPSVKDVKNEIHVKSRRGTTATLDAQPAETSGRQASGQGAPHPAPQQQIHRSDGDLQGTIYDALDNDPNVPDHVEITVNVNEGRATLQGRVPSSRIKRAAGNDAWSIPGIRDVYNELNVMGRADRARSTTTKTNGFEVERRSAK